jgi:hypothetical protein
MGALLKVAWPSSVALERIICQRLPAVLRSVNQMLPSAPTARRDSRRRERVDGLDAGRRDPRQALRRAGALGRDPEVAVRGAQDVEVLAEESGRASPPPAVVTFTG